MKKYQNIVGVLALSSLFLASFIYAVQPKQTLNTQAADVKSSYPQHDTSVDNVAQTNTSDAARSSYSVEKESQRQPQFTTNNGSTTGSHSKKIDAGKVYYALNTPNDSGYSAAQFNTINAVPAWGVTTGSVSVTVAVIDSGFGLGHEDLIQQWHRNLGETGGGKESDGIDNDGNGYVDDYRGWDFSAADNLPQAGEIDLAGQGVSHGTEVAGLIGATGNNGRGSTGVSWNTSLLPLQVLSDDGSGYSNDIVDAVYYAVAQGADIINMSLGTSGDDPDVRAAVDYAISRNVVVIAAAGNCGNSNAGACAGQVPGYVTFPASYNKVIAVGAVDDTERRAGFSSYGQRVDIMAPGSGVLVSPTWSAANQTSRYASRLYGTSYASPIVAGAAALLRSVDSFAPEEVKALLLASSRKTSAMSSLYSTEYGHGILDIGKSTLIAGEFQGHTFLQSPALVLAGGIRPEHDAIYYNTTSIGCRSEAASWCTVLLQNNAAHYDRYLPYKLTDTAGLTYWSWSGGLLADGLWQLSARQSNHYSDIDLFEIKNN